MSRLSDIVSYRKSQGGSIAGSLAGGIKERLKEKFDPRQLINQKGLMTSLFPGLKAYKAKTGKSSTRISGKSIEKSSVDVSEIKPIFENIQSDTRITAKNLSVLPAIHRDFNVIRQNIVKLVKLEKIGAVTKTDMFFRSAAKREAMYESQLSNIKKENSPEKQKIKNSSQPGSMMDFVFFAGVLGIAGLALKGVYNAVEKIRNIDLKDAIDDFLYSVNRVIDEVMSIKISPEPSDYERELSSLTFSDLTEEQKTSFLEAQAKAEGFGKEGTKPTELKNPGAMLYRPNDASQKSLGAKPSTKHSLDVNGKKIPFAEFPTAESGKKAQREKWESKSYSKMPLNEAIRKWSGTTNEDTESSRNYMKQLYKSLKLGLIKKPSGNRKIEDIAPEGFKMKKIEGNFGTYGQMDKVENIILHHTGPGSLRGVFSEFERFQKDPKTGKNLNYKHGVQYVIDRDGTVYNLAPDTSIMYHAGTKSGVTNLNSIGVEILSPNSESFTEAQKKSAKSLVAYLRKKHGNLNVVGHGEIAKHKSRNEGRALAEEIRKNSPILSPISMGNMGENIDSTSFNVSFGSMSEEIPLVFINNLNNQENVTIVQSENKTQDHLSVLFQNCVA